MGEGPGRGIEPLLWKPRTAHYRGKRRRSGLHRRSGYRCDKRGALRTWHSRVGIKRDGGSGDGKWWRNGCTKLHTRAGPVALLGRDHAFIVGVLDEQ